MTLFFTEKHIILFEESKDLAHKLTDMF